MQPFIFHFKQQCSMKHRVWIHLVCYCLCTTLGRILFYTQNLFFFVASRGDIWGWVLPFNSCVCLATQALFVMFMFIKTCMSINKLIHIIITTFLSHTITLLYTRTHIHIQPRDPCPAYPVRRYVFNISDENGNILATISHTGNTSVNLNGSDSDLIRNQVYYLTAEAINAAGSTPSEEILLCKSIVPPKVY
jgi:hypothetical protein